MDKIISLLSLLSMIVVMWVFARSESLSSKRYNTLMKVMGGLKFRIFDLEARVLGGDGVYIPEDMAERYARFLESQMTFGELETIKKRYAEDSPPHIPFWKYLVTHFRLRVSVEQYGLISAVTPEAAQLEESLLRQAEQIKNIAKLVKQQHADMQSLTEMAKTVDGLHETMASLTAEVAASTQPLIQAVEEEPDKASSEQDNSQRHS